MLCSVIERADASATLAPTPRARIEAFLRDLLSAPRAYWPVELSVMVPGGRRIMRLHLGEAQTRWSLQVVDLASAWRRKWCSQLEQLEAVSMLALGEMVWLTFALPPDREGSVHYFAPSLREGQRRLLEDDLRGRYGLLLHRAETSSAR